MTARNGPVLTARRSGERNVSVQRNKNTNTNTNTDTDTEGLLNKSTE